MAKLLLYPRYMDYGAASLSTKEIDVDENFQPQGVKWNVSFKATYKPKQTPSFIGSMLLRFFVLYVSLISSSTCLSCICKGFPSSSVTQAAAATTLAVVVRQVEAKYLTSLFKQQLTIYVEKFYGIIRDNLKKELGSLLTLSCDC